MAGIDHTRLCFKNGRLFKKEGYVVGDDYFSYIPFKYNRDGVITDYEMDETYYDAPWSRFRIVRKWRQLRASKSLCCDKISFSFYSHGEKQIYLFKSPEYNATFYVDGTDAYAVLGGYGHYFNPYTHFYGRGYGEEFERKMAKECYRWLCTLLEECIDQRFGAFTDEADKEWRRLKSLYKYKDYFDMTLEERHYDTEHQMIEYVDV